MSYGRKFMIKYLSRINGEHKGEHNTMTAPQVYKQFFTPQKYSQVMIEAIEIDEPKKVIDLAMGEGSLLIEAKQKWANSVYYGNDIDLTCCERLPDEYTDIQCFHNDIFLNLSINKLIRKIGKVDLCLGNPPFHKIKQTPDIRNILKQFNLNEIYKSEFISSEVPFILQSFKILEQDGTLALILPDGFFTNGYLKKFRQFIIENYQVQKVMELPKNIFKKTQAKTHILILKNSKDTNSKIQLACHKGNFIEISTSEAIERMDYSFYKNKKQEKNLQYLSNLDVIFLRGKPKYLIKNIDKRHVLHTTNFKKGNIFGNNLRTTKKLKSYQDKIVMPGDIVLARVGTSCLGNIGYVNNGYYIATDCVFIIRTSKVSLRKLIYDALVSKEGQDWIKAHSKGVAARHITLEEIKKFPLNIKR